MSNKDLLQKVKAFGMTNQIVTEELQQIGTKFSIDLGHLPNAKTVEDIYYPQFDAAVRAEASIMSAHYEVFYCLEKSIRELVSETIAEAEKSEDWWDSKRISEEIKKEVKFRIQKEVDAGITRRSIDELDYTTFGELSDIITDNWDIFGGLFSNSSQKALRKIMTSLNSLRNPIAHCSPLAKDEVLRLQLTVQDWFRIME